MTLQKHILANFKPPKGYAREKRTNSKTYKDRPGMSDAHLALLRKLLCCVCGSREPNECHHLKQDTNERGMGLRSTDKHAIPLCRHHHAEVEGVGSKNERQYFLDKGIDALALADALWRNTGDQDRMHKIILAHWMQK